MLLKTEKMGKIQDKRNFDRKRKWISVDSGEILEHFPLFREKSSEDPRIRHVSEIP